MKYLLTLSFLAFASTASAKTVYYPQDACSEIVSAEYSTGGGDSSFEMYEILCKSKEGKYASFVVSWGSAAGFFGMGRYFSEEVIHLEPYDGSILKTD